MTHTHRIVNGERIELTTEEIAECEARDAAAAEKRSRVEQLKPLKDFYARRKAEYAAQLGSSPEEQIGAILEAGSLAGMKSIYDQIRTVDLPWTPELIALKDSCTAEELKQVRG